MSRGCRPHFHCRLLDSFRNGTPQPIKESRQCLYPPANQPGDFFARKWNTERKAKVRTYAKLDNDATLDMIAPPKTQARYNMRMPAPKRYDPARFLPEIHAWIESGKTLRAYCRQYGKPSYSTVYDWLEADAKTAEKAESTRFARAREIGEAQILQECLEIADNTQVGEIVTQKVDGSTEIKRADMIEHRKLRIETRLKLLAKWNPKKYGDKLALDGEIGIRTVLVPKPIKDTAPRPATTPDFEA